jgi:ubiquinone/menaquinone biosynthesis C-methylase UbiE
MMRMFRVLLRENGILWTLCFAAHWPLRHAAESLERSLRELERRRGLSGVHSPDVQRELWQNYDWSRGGEEWTATEEWKRSVVDHVMLPELPSNAAVLEIGPGAGRWTEELQKRARRLVLVDVAQSCIDACQSRFAGATNVEYNVNDGRTLPFVPDASIEFAWSFDVFVHIGQPETKAYLKELARVLVPNARAVIHHGKEGSVRGGWRSPMTAAVFEALAREAGLRVIKELEAWGDRGQYDVRHFGDVITVLQR